MAIETEIFLGVLAFAQAVTLALIGKNARDSSRSRKQVENAHFTPDGKVYNLRDNIDDNHHEVLNAIGRVERDLAGAKKDIGRLDDRDLANHKFRDLTTKRVEYVATKLDKHLEWSEKYVRELEERREN